MKVDFDVVILVDCWDKRDEPENYDVLDKFYLQIATYLRNHEFKHVIFTNQRPNIRVIDKSIKKQIYTCTGQRPQFHEVSNMWDLFRLPIWEEFNTEGEPFYKFQTLYGGRAWGACIHFGSNSIGKFMAEPFDVYTSSEILTNEGDLVFIDEIFDQDPLIEWKKVSMGGHTFFNYNCNKELHHPIHYEDTE